LQDNVFCRRLLSRKLIGPLSPITASIPIKERNIPTKTIWLLLKENRLVISMSRKANCYDNAVAESFFKTIKTELARTRKFASQDEARSAIFEYIEVFL